MGIGIIIHLVLTMIYAVVFQFFLIVSPRMQDSEKLFVTDMLSDVAAYRITVQLLAPLAAAIRLQTESDQIFSIFLAVYADSQKNAFRNPVAPEKTTTTVHP